MTHLIAESEVDVQSFVTSEQWQLVKRIKTFEGWKLGVFRKIVQDSNSPFVTLEALEFGDLFPHMVTKQQLWILERKR